MRELSKTKIGLLFFLALISFAVCAEVRTCGLKTITLKGKSIIKIVHEDGTVHTGASVSNNWIYSGDSISHWLMKEPIECDGKAKSRNEIVTELSGRFAKSPDSYGMTPKEADLMGSYTADLMKNENQCYLIVDAAKSTQRPGMFYIDCNDKHSITKRYWISQKDLIDGNIKSEIGAIASGDAIMLCNERLKAHASNPSTYDPYFVTGTSSRTIERTGRNIVEINFDAANSFGVVGKFTGHCILEAGELLEVTINER